MTRPPKSALCWSPLIDGLEEIGREAGTLSLLVSPFATLEAVKRLLESVGNSERLQVVCRWSASDLVTGFADLQLYPFLRSKGIRLFLHPRIHLKLYVFDGNAAFHSSGNATGAGLGLGTRANVEVGCRVDLMPGDWDQLFQLLEESEAVDDDRFRELQAYQDSYERDYDPPPPLTLTPSPARAYSILSLPATPSPDVFADWYQHKEDIPLDSVSRFEHDRALYRVPHGLTRPACLTHLRRVFSASPFIADFVEFLRCCESAAFGRVKAWLQGHCSDKPVPFRWELTASTRILYDWLAAFHEEITWDRPQHSMVIRWNDSPTQHARERRRRR